MFKNLRISTKILMVILLVAIVSQITIVAIAYTEMLNLSHYSQDANITLGAQSAEDSKNALKNQAESYLLEISSAQADISNSLLARVRDEVAGMAIYLEDIYAAADNFTGEQLPLPDQTLRMDYADRYAAVPKAYAVDPQHTAADGSVVLVYDPGFDTQAIAKPRQAYTLAQWSALSGDERSAVLVDNVVVSPNLIPDQLAREIRLLSNATFLFKQVYINDTTLENAYIGTETGISYRYSVYNSATRYDPRIRPWYTDAVDALAAGIDDPVWQSTYVDSTGSTCVTCSKAYRDADGQVAGVVAIDIYLTTIKESILNLRIGQTGYAFMLDETGEIIMHPDYEDAQEKERARAAGQAVEDSEPFDTNPLENPDTAEDYRQVLLSMKAGQRNVQEATIDEKNYYVAFSPTATTGWSLGVVTEVEEVISPALATKAVIDQSTEEAQEYITATLQTVQLRFIVIFAICSMLVLIFAFLLSNTITKPVVELTKGVEKIGRGNLDYKIELKTQDEVGLLAQAFNKMTTDLQEYMENLERTTAEKERIGSELRVASSIQSDMLPKIFPVFAKRRDVALFADSLAAKEVGGDFYDFFFLDDRCQKLCTVMADVSGKGIPAALFMVISKTLIKNQALSGYGPAEILTRVNDQLAEDNTNNMFVTVFLSILDISTGKLVYANGGHNCPAICRKDGEYRLMKTGVRLPLAAMPAIRYAQEELQLAAGDTIFYYTDGVTEAFNPQGEEYGESRLLAELNRHTQDSVEAVVHSVYEDVKTFAGEEPQSDDITVLILRYLNDGE